MNFQEVLQFLFPYLHGIRKLNQYLSVELIFPKTWEFPQSIIEKAQVEQNEKYSGEGYHLIFVAEVSHDTKVDEMLDVIADLITHNLEKEEKERLLKSKVIELKEIFKNASLEDLKTLKFDFEEYDDIDELLEDEIETDEV
jgi:hypothetical protein